MTAPTNAFTTTLPHGHKSKGRDGQSETLHRNVVFGKRLTAADLIKIEEDAQSGPEVQRNLLHARAAITAFDGLTRIPPPLSVLMSLGGHDREALLEGYIDFLRDSLGDRVAESLSPTEFKTAFGLEVEGEVYDVLVFADSEKQFTGYDDLKVEKKYGTGIKRDLAFIGREVVGLAQSGGGLTIEGEVSAETLARLDAFDFGRLSEFFAIRRDHFRSR